MKYSIGDLFVSCGGGTIRYIESIVETPQEATCSLYNMIYINEELKWSDSNVTETYIDVWIKAGSWKHYPVKKDNK